MSSINREITVNNLTRVYNVVKKDEGLKGSFSYLFKKKRESKVALNNFSCEIEEGEFIGLIGPNGAGKTTFLKMITGIIQPTQGRMSVFGHNPQVLTDEYKKTYTIVMGQKTQLWLDLPAKDSFLLNKEIYEIPQNVFDENIKYFSSLFEVEHLLDRQVRHLSLGERLKMEIIASLLHNPKILFLDEPTIGLDALAQKRIRQFLKKINKERKTTIILTSHYIEDIKELCNRVIVINNGKKVYDGAFKEILKDYNKYKFITIKHSGIDDLQLGSGVEVDIINQYESKIKAPKNQYKKVLNQIVKIDGIEDFVIEDEPINDLIEEIYNRKSVSV